MKARQCQKQTFWQKYLLYWQFRGTKKAYQIETLPGLPLLFVCSFPRTGASLERTMHKHFIDIFKQDQESGKGYRGLVVLYRKRCPWCNKRLAGSSSVMQCFMQRAQRDSEQEAVVSLVYFLQDLVLNSCHPIKEIPGYLDFCEVHVEGLKLWLASLWQRQGMVR